MKQQKLLNKNGSHFWALCFLTLKKNLPFILFGSVFALLACPIYPLISAMKTPTSAENFASSCMIGATLGLVVSLLLAAVLTLVNFGFMHSKNGSDLFYALPVTRRCLFGARLLATFMGAAVPALLAGVTGYIFTATRAQTDILDPVTILIFLAAGIITTAVLCCIMAAFMLFAGHSFDAAASFAVLNISIPLILWVGSQYIGELLYGASSSFISGKVIFSTSPLGGLGIWMTDILSNMNHPQRALQAVLWAGVVWMVLGLITLAVCLFFCKKRKSEQAGEAYAHWLLPLVMQLCVAVLCGFLLGQLFSMENAFDAVYCIFAVIGAILAAILLGAIIKRGFKRVMRDMLTGAITGIAVVLFGIILQTGGFGYETRIPSVEKVQSVSVELNTGYMCCISGTKFTDTEDIQNVLALHHAILSPSTLTVKKAVEAFDDSMTKAMAESEASHDFSILYTLKNGNTMKRTYSYSVNDTLQACEAAIMNSNNYLNNIQLKQKYSTETPTISFNKYRNDDIGPSNASGIFSLAQAKTLIDAYVQDIRTGRQPNPELSYEIRVDGIRLYDEDDYSTISLTVSDSFERTLAALKAMGYDLQAEELWESVKG